MEHIRIISKHFEEYHSKVQQCKRRIEVLKEKYNKSYSDDYFKNKIFNLFKEKKCKPVKDNPNQWNCYTQENKLTLLKAITINSELDCDYKQIEIKDCNICSIYPYKNFNAYYNLFTCNFEDDKFRYSCNTKLANIASRYHIYSDDDIYHHRNILGIYGSPEDIYKYKNNEVDIIITVNLSIIDKTE